MDVAMGDLAEEDEALMELHWRGSATMASEDVLERAERLLAKCPGYELPDATDIMIVEDLAAEVRELRKDKARLDWLLSGLPIEVRGVDEWAVVETRDEIDAAMGGGEG